MAITLPQSCATCCHFDGDYHCALPVMEALISGHIENPTAVVCIQWNEQNCQRCEEKFDRLRPAVAHSGWEMPMCDDCHRDALDAQARMDR